MRLTAPLIALILAISAGAVMADDPNNRDRDDNNRRASRGHHMDRRDRQPNDAAVRAQQQTGGGRVLSVQPTDDGRHRVKVLKDGEVHVLTVDPKSEQNR